MQDIIDFDTGSIIDGKKNVEECAFELLNYIVDVASGKIDTKARLLDKMISYLGREEYHFNS